MTNVKFWVRLGACVLFMGVGMLMVFTSPILASTLNGTIDSGIGSSGVTGEVPYKPTASPVAGTYTSTQSVTLSSLTSGATIRYTTDGSTPTCASGTLYSSALSVSSSQTIKAIACKGDSGASSVASFAYTISEPTSTSAPGGGVVTPTMPVTATGQVTATAAAGGKTTLTTPEGTKATVVLPANAVAADTVVKIEKVETGTIIIAAPAPTSKTIVSAFNFTAIAAGRAVTTFARTVTITLTYTDAQVVGLDEASLKIYRRDGTKWVVLPSTVNTATNTITATTTSFSYFAIMGEPSVITPPAKPITEMTVAELQAEIVRITALIAQLQAQLAELIGVPAIVGVPAEFSFQTNLKYGQVLTDVKYLQIVLNSDPETRLAATGVGSPGRESNIFGPLTKAAVIKFQKKYASEVLAPWELTKGTGFIGSTTRAKLNEILGR